METSLRGKFKRVRLAIFVNKSDFAMQNDELNVYQFDYSYKFRYEAFKLPHLLNFSVNFSVCFSCSLYFKNYTN